jgi:DNA-binding MarR family transcriptional regulator
MESKSIGRAISCIHRNTKSHIQKELQKYNLGSGQLHFLMTLYREDGINQEHLAQHLNMDKATSARAIKKLYKEGYVTRKIDESDKRAYKIYLTDKAKKIESEIRRILKEWTNTLITGFNENEKKLLYEFLERIAKNASEHK